MSDDKSTCKARPMYAYKVPTMSNQSKINPPDGSKNPNISYAN